MARPKFNFVVLDPGSGRARPGALVSVYAANTLTLSSLFADDDVSALANPVVANGIGEVAFRVNPGIYDIRMSWDGTASRTVEDVLAWTPEAAVLTQPGDILIGGPTGPQSLPIGEPGEVLVVNVDTPDWSMLGSGKGLPVGPEGSMITYDVNGDVEVLPPGPQDYMLAVSGGKPTWVTGLLPPGTTLPINTKGDLVVGGTTGLPARLAIGTEGHVLSVVSGTPGWVPFSLQFIQGRGIGRCRLDLAEPNLKLSGYDGNQIWIDGALRTIPSAGVLLAPTGLVVDTNYYIYAAWVGSAIVLEATTIGHTLTDGLRHKTGDETRTLVGLARPVTVASAPAWVSDDKRRFVLSWFSRRAFSGESNFTVPRATTSTVIIELNQEIRSHFLCWTDTVVVLSITGRVTNSVGGTNTNTQAALDGVAVGGTSITASIANESSNIGMTFTETPLEGMHYLTLLARCGSGQSATWQGDVAGLNVCRTQILTAG